MAERSQLQYQPITGPVWREPVAEQLAWLPRVQQPARGLARAGVAPFAQPPFEALYDPRRLEWLPGVSRPARGLGRALLDWSVYPPRVAAEGYDPASLDWLEPARPAVARSLSRASACTYALDPIPPAAPALLDWQSRDSYSGRALARPAPRDFAAYPLSFAAPAFDPQGLEWVPRVAWPRPQEQRRLGDFASPAFEALFRPDGLQWQAVDRYVGRSIPLARQGAWVVDPAPFEPSGLQWLAADRYAGRALPNVLGGSWVIDPLPPANPATMQWALGGLQPARTVAFVRTGAFVVDPTTPAPVVFDPGAFPFSTLALVFQRGLPEPARPGWWIVDPTTPPDPPPAAAAGADGSRAPRRRRLYLGEEDDQEPTPRPTPRPTDAPGPLSLADQPAASVERPEPLLARALKPRKKPKATPFAAPVALEQQADPDTALAEAMERARLARVARFNRAAMAAAELLLMGD